MKLSKIGIIFLLNFSVTGLHKIEASVDYQLTKNLIPLIEIKTKMCGDPTLN